MQVDPIAAQNKALFLSGPAATDAITGINRYTFRSGRQTRQDLATTHALVGDTTGKKILATNGGSLTPTVVRTLTADETAPPVVAMK